MKRFCTDYLIGWLHSTKRKPLVLRGARQVGKTWIVRHLADIEGKQLIELNLEERKDLAASFESNDPKTILRRLESALDVSMVPEKSILFLDEIQAAPELIAKLRWFYEKLPTLPVIAAGSLLEFSLREFSASMPVGRITYMYLEPFSFEEFLLAQNKQQLLRDIETFSLADDMPQFLHDKLMKLFKEYIVVGGMPEAVASWVEEKSLQQVGIVHGDLLSTYRDDFRKYSGRLDPDIINDTLTYIPKALGEKFVFSQVRPQSQVPAIKKALNLLCLARVAHKVKRTSANGLPLAGEASDSFLKAILLDVGLCSSALDVSFEHLHTVKELEMINRGGIAEQVVGQLLRTINPFNKEASLYYWIRPKKGSSAEIDYLIQHRGAIVPIEVKAGKTGRLKSLQVFMQAKKLPLAVRINSTKPQKTTLTLKKESEQFSYELRSLPFYLVGQLHRLCD